MEVEFRGWDDDIAVVHVISHVLGPVSDGHPINIYALWALFYARPTLFLNAVINIDAIDEIMVAMSEGRDLSKFWEQYPYVFELVNSVEYPEKFKEAVLKNYNAMKDFVNENGVVDEALALFPEVEGKIIVYPSFEVGKHSVGGTVYKSRVIVMGFGWGEIKAPRMGRVFLHELLHVLEGRTPGCKELLEKANKVAGVPVHEAFTEVLTNYVWHRLGLQKEMFESYYIKHWKRLVEVEDVLREEMKRYDRGKYKNVCDIIREFVKNHKSKKEG